MYAIIQTGGKQYRISEGDSIFVEKLNADADSVVDFNNVIAVGKEDGLIVDSTALKNAKVVAKVLKNGKAKKISVFTYKAKKGCARKMGHRQPYTKVQIESIII